MSDDVDPFDEGVPRDGRGRPLIIPCKRDGTPNTKAKPKAYTRASTFAKALGDGGTALGTWKTRHAAVGVALRPDLAKMIAAMGPNPDEYPDDKAAHMKRDLDAIIERAHDASGGNVKADYGTAVHTLTEPDPFGSAIDEGMAADVAAYGVALDAGKLRAVDAEQFVVNDDLGVAGTYDHVYEVVEAISVDFHGKPVELAAGTRLIGDKKTGTMHADEHAIQLATYARARRYDYTTGERTAMDVSPTWGVLAHIPKGKHSATLYLVDLAAGWKAARLAVEVRAYRSGKSKLVAAFASGEVDAPEVPADLSTPVARVVDVRQTPDGITVEMAPLAPAESTPAEPEPAPAADETDAAVELVTRELSASEVDPIREAIKRAASRDECAALWREQLRAGRWRPEHDDAVRARLAELAA